MWKLTLGYSIHFVLKPEQKPPKKISKASWAENI